MKELLKDKDHVIKSLTKTTKLRKLIDSNYNDENKQSNTINDPNDKENLSNFKEFNINLKKPHVSLDITNAKLYNTRRTNDFNIQYNTIKYDIILTKEYKNFRYL